MDGGYGSRFSREGEGTGVDRWPLRKFPLLVDGERNIVETSIIIEYLQLAHPEPVRLLARRFGHPRTSE
jgi:glutathione S-transferase